MKKSGQWCFKLSFLLLLLVPATIGVSAASVVPTEPTVSGLGCPEPGSLTRTGTGSGWIAYSWSGPGGATGYQVYYVRLADSYTSSVMSTGSPAMNISGLAAGYYRFYFATVCADGTSDYVVIDDLIM